MGGVMKNWMTTIPGLFTLGAVVWNIWQTKTINVEDLRQALVGVGLVMAKDFNVTGIK